MKEEVLKLLKPYKYLGLEFSSTGSFKNTIESLKIQASRAMFSLISKARRNSLPIDIQLQLFDSLVLPIMLYGCEIWGNANIDALDKLHLKFLKMVLGVQGKTCNNIVYGELGRYPLEVYIRKRAIGFWARMLTNKESKISRVFYDHLRALSLNNHYKCKWIDFIKTILQDCDLHNIWQSHQFQSVDSIKSAVGKKLRDKFVTKWRNELNAMTSCDVYVNFKKNFKLEDYLTYLNPVLRRPVCALRTNNTRLPKVLGRFTGIPRASRHCTLCPDENLIGDEYHLLLECKNQHIVTLRNKYIPNVYYSHPSMQKCIDLLGSADKTEIRKLAYFLKSALNYFK